MNLIWLGAALLGGLVFALVPPLIHLISKRRARPVRFAAMEFVLRSQKRTARSLRLREFLLMALRILVVVLLALAVARPALRPHAESALSDKPVAVLFVLDTSASMQAREGRRTVFEKAVANIRDALEDLPDDVRLGLIACGHRVEEWVLPATFDRSLLADRLEDAKATWSTSDLGACVARAADAAARINVEGEKRIQVHSDLAKHALSQISAPRASGLSVQWVQAADDPDKANHAITDVQVGREGGIMGQVLKVDFEVAHFGTGESEAVGADLRIGDRTVARQMVDMKGRQRSRRTFTYALAAGQEEDAAKSEDEEAPVQIHLGDDALQADNTVTLPMSWPRPLKVLVVDGAPRAISFRDEVFFVENALRHQRPEDTELVVEVIAPEQVRHDLLAGAQVVVLANVGRLTDSSAAALIQFAKAGGGLLFSMGDRVDPEWMNESLGEILPGRLRGIKGLALLDDKSVAEALGLSRFESTHPVFQPFVSSGEGGGLVGLSRVLTHTLMLMEPQADAPRQVLVRFTNDAPALMERLVGTGRVLLWATSIDRDWTDLPIRPGYLPLVHQMVLYLGGALQRGKSPMITVGQGQVLALPRDLEAARVVRPDGETFSIAFDENEGEGESTHFSRVPTEEEAEGAQQVIFNGTWVPGLYRVFFQREGGEFREWKENRFTVLVDKSESDLSPAEPEDLKAALPAGVRAVSDDAEEEVPLWPLALLLAALLVVAEAAFLSRWARGRW
jgi:hypothetical protein